MVLPALSTPVGCLAFRTPLVRRSEAPEAGMEPPKEEVEDGAGRGPGVGVGSSNAGTGGAQGVSEGQGQGPGPGPGLAVRQSSNGGASGGVSSS